MAVLEANPGYYDYGFWNFYLSQGDIHDPNSLSNVLVASSLFNVGNTYSPTDADIPTKNSIIELFVFSPQQGQLFSANAIEGNSPFDDSLLSNQGEIQLYANSPFSESVAKSSGLLYSGFLESQELVRNSKITREGDTHPITINSKLGGQGERLKESNYAASSPKTLFSGEFSYSIDQLFGNQSEDMVIVSKESLLKIGLIPALNNSPESLYLAILLFSKEALDFEKDKLLPSVSIDQRESVLVTRNSKYYKQDSYTVTLQKEDTKPIIEPDDY